MTSDTITLRVGQVVPWPAAPMGFAQISDLRRSRVTLCYPFKRSGRVARPVVRVDQVAKLLRDAPLLFPLHNPFDRGVLPREKSYKLPPPRNCHVLREGGRRR